MKKNPIDAIVGFFAPKSGLERSRARLAMRAYDGALSSRRSASWTTRHASANAEIAQALQPLRDRSRDLSRNSPHAPRMLDILVSHSVGTGIRPVPNTGSDALDVRVTRLWNDWQESADVEDIQTFEAMQALGVRSMIESGEFVIRFIDGTFKKNHSPIPLQLQLLESDFIDHYREGIFSAAGQGVTDDTLRSRLGVGLGDFDRRTGLWLWPYHPGEVTTYNMRPGISKFHPSDELLHVFRMLRPGQVRGVPWFAPVLMTARDLSDFLDAVMVKARVEACFSAFVTNSDELDPVIDPSTDGYQDPNNPRAMVTTLEPGMIKELRQGQDIKFASPTTTSQVEPMLMFGLQAMAAGVGCTYDQATGDLRQANYSSLRAGKMDFRRLIEQLQNHVIIPRLCAPVWKRFVSRAILSGELRPRAGGYPCSWVTPAWEPIDPKKDLEADKSMVRSGRMTPQEFMATWGNDWRKNIDEFAAFFKYADKAGVIFDIDPRKMSGAGQAQAEPGAEGPEGAAQGSGGGPAPKPASGAPSASVIPFPPAKARAGEYEEDQHPRDEHGLWSSKGKTGDSGAGSGAKPATAAPAKPALSRPKGGRKVKGTAEEFISPNVATGVQFEQAASNLGGTDQKHMQKIAADVDKRLGLDDTKIAEVIGAWTDGAENSVMITHESVTLDELRVAAAMKGYLANQKSVLVFSPHEDGEHFMAYFDVAAQTSREVHEGLLKTGLASHTLEDLGAGKFRVHVYGSDQGTFDQVGEAAKSYGTGYRYAFGTGEYVGAAWDFEGTDDEQRAEARRVYEGVIQEASSTGWRGERNVGAVWQGLRSHWRAGTEGDDEVKPHVAGSAG